MLENAIGTAIVLYVMQLMFVIFIFLTDIVQKSDIRYCFFKTKIKLLLAVIPFYYVKKTIKIIVAHIRKMGAQ